MNNEEQNINEKKKDWQAPDFVVLDVESTRATSGTQSGADNNYKS